MGVFSEFCEGMIYKGGVLAAGVTSLYLYKTRKLPRYMGPVSYGITSIGVCGVVAYFYKEEKYATLVQEDGGVERTTTIAESATGSNQPPNSMGVEHVQDVKERGLESKT